MKKIKWLTEKQVKKAAMRGRKAALLCSIKHWEQLSSANKEQIMDVPDNHTHCNFCALCIKYDFIQFSSIVCSDCGLHCLRGRGTKSGIWCRASDTFGDYQEFQIAPDWIKWKRTSKALLRRIIKLYEREYGAYKHKG